MSQQPLNKSKQAELTKGIGCICTGTLLLVSHVWWFYTRGQFGDLSQMRGGWFGYYIVLVSGFIALILGICMTANALDRRTPDDNDPPPSP
jgi:hypothetical protein